MHETHENLLNAQKKSSATLVFQCENKKQNKNQNKTFSLKAFLKCREDHAQLLQFVLSQHVVYIGL